MPPKKTGNGGILQSHKSLDVPGIRKLQEVPPRPKYTGIGDSPIPEIPHSQACEVSRGATTPQKSPQGMKDFSKPINLWLNPWMIPGMRNLGRCHHPKKTGSGGFSNPTNPWMFLGLESCRRCHHTPKKPWEWGILQPHKFLDESFDVPRGLKPQEMPQTQNSRARRISPASGSEPWLFPGFFQVIFLDDLGENLKAARELGMATILVRDTESALRELQELSGIQVWKNGLGSPRSWHSRRFRWNLPLPMGKGWNYELEGPSRSQPVRDSVIPNPVLGQWVDPMGSR